MFQSVQGTEHFRGAMPEGEGFFSRAHWLFYAPPYLFFFFFLHPAGWATWVFFRNTGFPGAVGTGFLCAHFKRLAVSFITSMAFNQRKRLLNAIRSLHQDLTSSSSPRCRNRCVEASIELFVPIDGLLPFRFVRMATIQPSRHASLASDYCFHNACPCLCSNNSFTLS